MEPKSGNDEDAKIGNGYSTATTTTTTATDDNNKPVNDFSGEVVPAVGSPSDVAVNGTCRSSRTPFTNLSQVDADLALARTLQEQERAYMMLSTGGDGVAYRGWADYGFSYDEDQDDDDEDDDDDDFDHHSGDYIGTDAEVEAEDYAVGEVHAHDEDEDVEYDVENDEEYARAIQDIEDQDVAARLLSLAGLNDEVVEDIDEQDDDDDNAQGMWDEVDPDELSYEELLALGEVVGTESRGLSADVIASLPSFSYKTAKNADASCDPCVICRLEYEEDDTLTVLSCKHSYHSECINNWLNINKICPVCSTEVSTSGNA